MRERVVSRPRSTRARIYGHRGPAPHQRARCWARARVATATPMGNASRQSSGRTRRWRWHDYSDPAESRTPHDQALHGQDLHGLTVRSIPPGSGSCLLCSPRTTCPRRGQWPHILRLCSCSATSWDIAALLVVLFGELVEPCSQYPGKRRARKGKRNDECCERTQRARYARWGADNRVGIYTHDGLMIYTHGQRNCVCAGLAVEEGMVSGRV